MENDKHAYHLRKLVEELTTSGKDQLDVETMKRVKKICKRSDIYVIELYRLLSKQLKKKHAEIRFSCFQIYNEIFCRSHCFRELLLKDFIKFIDLVLGLDPKNPLPKPEAVARKLKQKCVETLQSWYDSYGKGYPTLRRGYVYLRDCKKVDFAELTARTEAERQRAEEERQRTEELKRKKIEKVTNELEEHTPEIKNSLLQFQNCFKLLIPDVHDFFIVFDDEDISQEGGFLLDDDSTREEGGFVQEDNAIEMEDEKYGSDFMRGHGILKGANIVIDLEDVRKVQETADNEIVIENLKEHINLFNTKLLPQVRKWEQIMQPYGEGNGRLIKRIVETKQQLLNAVKIFGSLQILPKKSSKTVVDSDSDSDDDDDFVEVPFDDPRVIRAAESEAALLGMTSSSTKSLNIQPNDPDNQPSTSGSSQASNNSPQTEGKVKTTKQNNIRCPDEYLSETDTAPKRLHNPLAGLSQVWTATPDLHEQDEVVSTGGIMGVATQRVNYERTWEPVKWACRAPLPNGSLCPRKDREKCPMHGPIIPRDEAGAPLLPEDAAREKAAKEKYEREHPAWQDPQLLAELKAATGVDLKVTHGRQKRKRKYENLTDLKKTTPRERLKKKVFSRKAICRLNSALAKERSSAPTTSSDFNFSRS